MSEPLGDHDAAILDVRDHRFFTLHATARLVYERARAGDSPPQIRAALHQQYDVDGETCAREVEQILPELTEAGLVPER